jgi:hypothetical protein
MRSEFRTLTTAVPRTCWFDVHSNVLLALFVEVNVMHPESNIPYLIDDRDDSARMGSNIFFL